MHALIDGDIPLYACGFAVETKLHKVYITGEEEAGYVEEFKYKKDLKALLKENEGMSYATDMIVEPLSHAIHLVDQLVDKIVEATGASEYTVFLTGDTNFRDELVDYYKKNRDPNHKPQHFKELKDYLINVHGAVIVDGQEADDALGIAQWKDYDQSDISWFLSEPCYESKKNDLNTVICTTDKDLDMIPGWHYNWTKDKRYWVDEEQAIRWFYLQLLMGDSTDNIKGIPGVGRKSAEKLLDGLTTEEEYFAAVKKAYNDRYCGAKHAGVITDGCAALIKENADLLWIRREENTGWIPPS